MALPLNFALTAIIVQHANVLHRAPTSHYTLIKHSVDNDEIFDVIYQQLGFFSQPQQHMLSLGTSHDTHDIKQLIIHMKKLLDSDWLRAVQLNCNTSAKSVTPVQKV